MKGKKKFVACVSLGYYCGVAASLEKYGLRSFSGPFDWVFSDIQGVLRLMENGFSDFLNKENLVVEEKKFFDTKYHLEFPHDVNRNFELEFDEIVERYGRRVENFKQKICEGVCFIRAIEVEEELQWVIENDTYIDAVIKKKNSKNEIKYLIPAYLDAQGKLPEKIYQLSIQEYKGNTPQELRNLLDPHEEFVAELVAEMNQDIYKDNMIFSLNKWIKKRDRWIADLKRSSDKQEKRISELLLQNEENSQKVAELTKEGCEKTQEISKLTKENQEKAQEISKLTKESQEKAQEISKLNMERQEKDRTIAEMSKENAANEFKYKTLATLNTTRLAYNKFPKQVDIYGVDNVGKIFCDMIRPYCKVNCFIDNFANIVEYNNIPVKKVDAYVQEEKTMVVITSPHDFEAIASMLQRKCGVKKEDILPIKKFLVHVKKMEEDLPSYRGKRRKKW